MPLSKTPTPEELCNELMCSEETKISNQKEFRKWALRHHPDKNPDWYANNQDKYTSVQGCASKEMYCGTTKPAAAGRKDDDKERKILWALEQIEEYLQDGTKAIAKNDKHELKGTLQRLNDWLNEELGADDSRIGEAVIRAKQMRKQIRAVLPPPELPRDAYKAVMNALDPVLGVWELAEKSNSSELFDKARLLVESAEGMLNTILKDLKVPEASPSVKELRKEIASYFDGLRDDQSKIPAKLKAIAKEAADREAAAKQQAAKDAANRAAAAKAKLDAAHAAAAIAARDVGEQSFRTNMRGIQQYRAAAVAYPLVNGPGFTKYAQQLADMHRSYSGPRTQQLLRALENARLDVIQALQQVRTRRAAPRASPRRSSRSPPRRSSRKAPARKSARRASPPRSRPKSRRR